MKSFTAILLFFVFLGIGAAIFFHLSEKKI